MALKMTQVEEVQRLMNIGYGISTIAHKLKINYYILRGAVKQLGIVPWPELSELERVTFVSFVQGKTQWDSLKPRMITKQASPPQVILKPEEYVRLLCMAAAYENLKKE